MFDFIGDIHGYADSLELLLQKLGYIKTEQGYKHSQRKVFFLGDFIQHFAKKYYNQLKISKISV